MKFGETPSNLGEVVEAGQVLTSSQDPGRIRNVILLLAASVALMMTGFGIIMPVFARRLGEFGEGVQALGLMTVAFALAQFLAAPVMGSLADRLGRRPLILVALATFAVVNVGFLFAPSVEFFIGVRVVEGALTAGLFPAAMGVVADTVPEKERARWVGIIMGSYGAGFIFGPVLGGFLYDGFGFAAPFLISAVFAVFALVAAASLVPETRTALVRRRERLRRRRQRAAAPVQEGSVWDSLPRPLYLFGTLLVLDFMGVFAFAFVEPEMVFYLYEELNWTTSQFGVVVGAYGLAMVAGQAGLGQASDRLGRKPVIIIGILLTTSFYVGMAAFTSFPPLLVVALVAGLGAALTAPALSAYYLDITSDEHRSRVVGIKESSASLGGVAGPLLVVGVSSLTTARGVFIIAGALMAATAALALVVLRASLHPPEKGETGNLDWECSSQRAMAAQAALRGLVLSASSAREARSTP